jgi:hypothetical protein
MSTSDGVTAERVAHLAAAARVPLTPDACARVARAVAPTAARFAASNVSVAFEIEPASVLVVGRAEIGRRSEIGHRSEIGR